MTRLEENKKVIEEMTGRAERKPEGKYEEMVVFQLGVIATMLADISKSLAVIAEKAESNDEIDVDVDISDMMHDIYMAGVNMAGEYQGCWVRFKDIEAIVNKYLP